jgi:GT2 family glycosyltransferase
VGAATGKLLRWDFEKGIKTDMIDSAGLLIFKSHRVIELGAGEQDGDKWNNAKGVFGVSGAAPVYRRKALRDVAADGGQVFDEDFFSYKEDVDLAYRLCMREWQAWFLPEARAYHDRTARATAGGDLGAMRQRKNKSSFINYHSYKNHFFFLTKNLTWPIFLRYFPHIFWYEFKKFIYILFFEVSTLKSLGEFARRLPKMWRKRRYIMANKKITTAEIRRWLE